MITRIGVAILFQDKKNRILLGKRISAHEGCRYGCPGGKVDPGESPSAAAYRELWEETRMLPEQPDGLEPTGYLANCVYPAEDNHFLCIWFTGVVDDASADVRHIELDAGGNPKFEGWNWYTRDEALAMPLMLSTLDALKHMDKRFGDIKIHDYKRA